MRPHDIVSARLPIASTDTSAPGPVPPARLSPAALEQRVLQRLSDRVDIYALFYDLCQKQVMAESAKAAAEQALLDLSAQVSAAWQASTGNAAAIVRDQIVYRKLPNGQHETIGYLVEQMPDGSSRPVEVPIQEGNDTYRCFVHVSVAARDASKAAADSVP